ncbi:glycosyltransferase family 2 protein [Paracoccus sp. JM45]|uniref:glycosyltransferase family 2 protein n=1 Tax=Paracoccus sp. JM45 TaxID=2283626 RepID=UPI001602DED6|nr:glycosyltransferase family 2 protein [Paracoccus sp. JM45]
MSISFIVTTYNIEPYISRCLQSVAGVAIAGDEVIVIDDGSDDGTVEAVRTFIDQAGFGADIAVRPVYLGTNTMGGVGIGANIGLAEATKDTVFFVDGDDWIEPEGFRRARAHWAMHPTDILFTNYLEFDQKADRIKHPADAQRWARLVNGLPLTESRILGLDMIAVPWRKFYSRDFLEREKLRFPEGDFFFEDNPFHWAVCLAANSIGFINAVTCCHRINRPGQTMASTGIELVAFFTHFKTIIGGFAVDDRDNLLVACRWLLNNMTWHITRLEAGARYRYGQAASSALQQVPDYIWSGVAKENSEKQIWPVAERLRNGDIDGQVLQWQNKSLEQAISGLNNRIRALESQSAKALSEIRGLRAAETFANIRRMRDAAQ